MTEVQEKLPGTDTGAGLGAGLVAFSLSAFGLVTAVVPMSLFHQRSIHLALVLILAFLWWPASGRSRKSWSWLVDLPLIALSIASAWYLLGNLDAIFARAGFWTQTDVVMGVLTVLVLLEATRRVLGWTITLLGLGFIIYAYFGPYMPGMLHHRGYDGERLAAQLYLGQEGIYGIPLGVAATYVFIFVLFGSVMQATGAGAFFIDLAYAVAGRKRGGPAKAAVIASGFMGSLSGSAIANVVTSGAFTSPLIRKVGYSKEEAGGIEAAASTGGQIMPPVMGAGAFLIAEFTGVPFGDLVIMSIIPALLYFFTVYLFIDLVAARRDLKGLPGSELPTLKGVLVHGWPYLAPLVVLVYLLMIQVSPTRVGFVAVVLVVLVWSLQRRRFPDIAEEQGAWGGALYRALVAGARNAVPISLACAVAGIFVGVIGLTGLGLNFSSVMLSFTYGSLLLALVMVALASLVLGLGLPVTASYVVLIVLTGPTLVREFAVPLIIAHLVVFWYSQDSNVTPPVALAAFAGAGIAGGDPMKTGIVAWRYAKGLYLIPIFMVFHPELVLGGAPLLVAWVVLAAWLALGGLVVALEGYFIRTLAAWERLLVGFGSSLLFFPSGQIQGVGLVLLLVLGGRIRWQTRPLS